MCDVTRKNFNKIYPEIIDQLQSATFISIDCEFSGLFNDENKCSLFDTPKARFHKLQNSLDTYSIIQFGVSTFKYERTENRFICSTYNFFITPTTALGNHSFIAEMTSIQFLCKNNFDFNKLFYDGIHYLNKSDEATALNMIEDGSLITVEIEKDIQKYCSKVAEWSGSDPKGSELELELDDETDVFIYLLHQEIRKRFANLWTDFGENGSIKIKRVNDSEKRLLLSNREENFSLKKKLFDSILGFSRIIKEIQNLKKPIIGHNFLMDLIMIYKQFYNPSQTTYREFKKSISDIFPSIYDTKTISFRLRESLKRENTWKSNILPDLYEYLKSGRGSTVVIFSPIIKHQNEEFIKTKQFHNAGFDSYIAGFCFVKMSHIFSLWDNHTKTFLRTSLPTSSSWLLAAVAPVKNHINISRGQSHHIVLDGEDPRSHRPGLLYIKSKDNQPLDVSKISEVLAKYTSVDIQLLTKYSGVMAVANKKQAKEILGCFKNNKEYEVTRYNFLKYLDHGRAVVSVTFIASVALVAMLLKKIYLS